MITVIDSSYIANGFKVVFYASISQLAFSIVLTFDQSLRGAHLLIFRSGLQMTPVSKYHNEG